MASVVGAGESVAVVVGASELGSATATLLARAGSPMVAADAVPKALDELPEGIRREMGDTTDQAVAKTLIDRIAGEVGPPEVLVNTIGGFLLDEAGNATPEDLRVMMDASLGAALWLSQVVEPYLRQRGSGATVHLPARPGTDLAAGAAYLAAVAASAAGPVISKYLGVLAAADVYTASTTFAILESLRLDLGVGSQIHP